MKKNAAKEPEDVTETYKLLRIMKGNLVTGREKLDSQVQELEKLIVKLMEREARIHKKGIEVRQRRNKLSKELARVKKSREEAFNILK